MNLVNKFDYSKVKYNQENSVNLMVSATAPKMDWKKERKPINLITAIDLSTSMGGSKIDYAKKSLMKLVDHLTSEDKLGIITFDSNVELISEPLLMTQENKDKLKQKIGDFYSKGWTNFSGAMIESLDYASKLDSDCRVLMFTDGCPTSGITDNDELIKLFKARISENTTLSTFGYGDDHDSEFLTKLAELGKGNYAYIKNPDDALSAFAKELGGLLSCYAQNLKFTITPKEGVEIMSVLSDVDSQEEGKGVIIPIPDLYSEETRNFLFEVKLPKQKKSFPRETSVVDIKLEYDCLTEKSDKSKVKLESVAKISYVKEADAQTDPDKEVANQLALIQVNVAQKQANKCALLGDFRGAKSAYDSVDLTYADDSVKEYAKETSSFYVDGVAYGANVHNVNASLSSARSGRASSTSTGRLYGSNSIQKDLVGSFEEEKKDDSVLTLDPNQTFGGLPPTSVTLTPKPVNVALPKVKPKKSLTKKRSDSQW